MNDVVTIERSGRVVLARCHGDLDIAVSRELRDRFSSLPDQDVHAVVVDLSDVTFLDASGLGALCALARDCGRREARVLLSGVRPFTRRLLDVVELTDLFVIVPDAAGAVALAEHWFDIAGPALGAPNRLLPFPPRRRAHSTDQGES